MNELSFAALTGKTLTEIVVADDKDEITLKTADGETYRLYHDQDCCENVAVEDVTGDLGDLIGSPLVRAEERSSDADNVSESGTWTFYELATVKGSVTIRWLGESNGYYSESVTLARVD